MTATGGVQGEVCITEMDEQIHVITSIALADVATEDGPLRVIWPIHPPVMS